MKKLNGKIGSHLNTFFQKTNSNLQLLSNIEEKYVRSSGFWGFFACFRLIILKRNKKTWS